MEILREKQGLELILKDSTVLKRMDPKTIEKILKESEAKLKMLEKKPNLSLYDKALAKNLDKLVIKLKVALKESNRVEKQNLESVKINPQPIRIDPEIQRKIKVREGMLRAAKKLDHRSPYRRQDMERMNNELIELKVKAGLKPKGVYKERTLKSLIWTKKDIKIVEKDIKRREQYIKSPECKRQHPKSYDAYVKVTNTDIANARIKINKDKAIIQLKKDNKLNFSTRIHKFFGFKSKSGEDHQIVGVNKEDASKRMKKELVQSEAKLVGQHSKLVSTQSRVQENKEAKSVKFDLSMLTKPSVVSKEQSDNANNTPIGKYNEVKKGRVGSRINNGDACEIQSILNETDPKGKKQIRDMRNLFKESPERSILKKRDTKDIKQGLQIEPKSNVRFRT
ncbi:hypothetical protein [Flavobacterium poyangense]|uniref:hypothetical protein n=1 Tax=Flavobacterium poyangense TaxID=2204302 RepID=UPI00141FCFBF|nr:hypothetical protein [Flavobacterium sp. JXAS1]